MTLARRQDTEEILTSIMTVKKASTVMGRDGPQWELEVTWPWTVGQNSDRIWLEKSQYPDEPGAGQYNVEVRSRGLKNKRDGGQHDGTKRWMHNWQLVRFTGPAVSPQPSALSPQLSDPDAEAPPQHTEPAIPETGRRDGASTPATYQEQQARGYDLGMAFNQAVHLAAAEPQLKPTPRTDAELMQRIRYLRDRLLAEVILTAPRPAHWCFDCGLPYDRTERGERGTRYHIVEGGYCVEGQGFLAKEA